MSEETNPQSKLSEPITGDKLDPGFSSSKPGNKKFWFRYIPVVNNSFQIQQLREIELDVPSDNLTPEVIKDFERTILIDYKKMGLIADCCVIINWIEVSTSS